MNIDTAPLTWLEEATQYIDSNTTEVVEISVLVVMGIVIWIVNRSTKLSALELSLRIFSVLGLTLYPLYALYHNNNVLEAFIYSAGIVAVVNVFRLVYVKGTDSKN